MRILSGWTAIAKHMQHGVRTVQRWERIGLPIRRPKGTQRNHVIAFAEELDAWSEAAPMQLLDVVTELKTKVETLEAQVLSLKQELKREKLKVLTFHNQRSGRELQ